MGVVAILTDFGTGDYYVGAVKGVILSRDPQAKIIDITHEISPGNILEGAFVLLHASRTFPPGTIFLAVVDPGVGTERKCIVIRTRDNSFFVGPDNGLLTLAARERGIAEIREIANPHLLPIQISSTFHGRDIFAPIAGFLSAGGKFEEIGPRIDKIVEIRIPQPERRGIKLIGKVIHVDRFGNLVTNLPSDVKGTLAVEIGTKRFACRVVKTFGEAEIGEKLAYVGSAGLLEFAINRGNLARELRVEAGARIEVVPHLVSREFIEQYWKQGYRIIQGNSAVKICHWTRESLLGGEGCYKSKFYGIKSWRCLQITPSLFNCTHRCLYCWRMIEATVREKIPPDDPEVVVEEAINYQRELLSGFKGNKRVVRERWEEAQEPKHAAISLAGEPLLYERLSELIREFKRRDFTTFVVSNGTVPERLEKLEEEPTQFYITLPAPDEDTYRCVCSPSIRDGWERIRRSLELFRTLRCRRVIRLTLVKGLNMKNPEGYGRLISVASPDFVEVKAYMHVGFSQYRLAEEHMPTHEEISDFARTLADEIGYKIADESIASRVVLLKK